LVLTGTDPKERLEGVAVSGSFVTPTPEIKSSTLGSDESFLNVMLSSPVLPLTVGAKTTVTPALCPGARTRGSFRFGTLNSAELTLIAEIVVLVAPALVTVTI
jgi:hypothetical protein